MAIVIPYVKQTWTDGSGGGTPVSAARLGVVEEGILDVSQAPAVRVFHNTTQSATSGVASTQHDTSTNNSRLTCLYAGIYMIVGNIEWSASPTTGQLKIRHQGT